MSISNYFGRLLTFVKSHLLRLNLFNSGIQDELIIEKERRSTRLYLTLLIISTVILTFYYFVTPYTHTIVIKKPTFAQYSTLVEKRPIECSCTILSAKYKQFVQIEPSYHELCQSYFISEEYINHLFILYEQSRNNSILTDFRRIGVFQFRTLRSFCELTRKTIENNREIFLETESVQPKLLSKEFLQTQINSLLADFVDMTPKMFLRTLRFIQDITAQSFFMTGASLTSNLPKDYQHVPYSGINYTFTNGSSCTCSSSTATSCMGPTTFENDIVHGFQTGCYMVNALLKSTLEVFYNQTFVNILTNSSGNFNKLNSSVANLTIETLLSQMFVTHWLNETFFEQYFNQCTPVSCQYTVTERYDFLLIITILIGLLGGLSAAFQIIAPFIIMKIWPIVWKFIVRRQTPITQSVENDNQRVTSVRVRIKEYFHLIKEKMIKLNLFESVPPSQDENVLRQERYTTRFYLILLLLIVIILTLFTSIRTQTIHVIKKSPSLTDFIQLYDQYQQILDCPCSQPAIDKQFICHLKPQYHEVCLSEFVSPNWINVQFFRWSPPLKQYPSPLMIIFADDIRYQSQFHFQLLSTLCKVANQTIQDSLQSFYRTKFVTNQVISNQSFQTQIDLTMEQFTKTVPESFQRTLDLLKTNFENNLFITPKTTIFRTGINFAFPNSTITLNEAKDSSRKRSECERIENFDSFRCYCFASSFQECDVKTVIDDNYTIYNIPGMVQSWYPLQSLLNSTLECFYNDTCLSQIKQYINSSVSPTNFTTLKSSSLSLDNNQYDKIELLAKNLFIESWTNESSFQSYFNQCTPSICQYTYKSRPNVIYIVTTIIGLIGGVNSLLRLLLPLVIKLMTSIWSYILQRQQRQINTVGEEISTRTKLYNRLRTLLILGKQSMIELNLFETIPPSKDLNMIQRNRRTTRVYLILLITSLFILILYTSLRRETITSIVESPSMSKYIELSLQYPRTLQCTCKHIAIKYNKFISQFEPQYHQICSSVFVSSEWFKRIVSPSDSDLFENEFRRAIRMQFQILAKLCTLSKKMLNTSLSIFGDTDFITADVISRDQFNVRIETLIKQFKKTTSKEFMDIVRLIQVVNHGNQLATLYSSNWRFIQKYSNNYHVQRWPPQTLDVLTLPRTYGAKNCSCAVQSNCSQMSNFSFRVSNESYKQTLPGFHIGCTLLDATLQSSLIGLYNQTYLNRMQASFFHEKPIPAESLNYSSLFPPNTTIETILSQLFVSKWLEKKSFDRYFNECAPQSCQYSYSNQYNPLYTLTTLMALFGGLTKGLHFVLYCIQLIIIKFSDRQKKRNQVSPNSRSSDIAVINPDNDIIEMGSVLPSITIQSSANSVNEQTKSRYRGRMIIICLSLLSIAALVTISVIWLKSRNEEQTYISSTTQTTQINNISTETESTSTLNNKCHMTLKYQFQTYPTGLSPMSFITGDFNQDLIEDLVVTNYDSHTLSLMLGNGDGTFQTQQNYSTGNGSGPREIVAGYFNNDTLLDLVVVLAVTKRIVIFFGIATKISLFSSPYTFPDYNSIPLAIVTSDLNDDGFFDLVISRHAKPPTELPLNIFLNLGDGRHFRSIYFAPDAGHDAIITNIVIGDFKGINEKYLTLFFIHSFVNTYYMFGFDYLNSEWNGFLVETNFMYGNASILVKGRFNDDEFDDFALIFHSSDTLVVLLSDHRSSSIDFIQQIYLTYNTPTSITRINFNNDTIDDLAILSCNGTMTVFLATEFGFLDQNYLIFETSTNTSGKCFHSLKINDFNQDGRDDLVFIDAETNSIKVLLGTPCKNE